MDSGCFGCTQKIIADNEQKEQALKLAQQKADETGEWYGVYEDNGYQVLPATAPGYPFKQFFSPNLQPVNA